jgi:hypothetical protein
MSFLRGIMHELDLQDMAHSITCSMHRLQVASEAVCDIPCWSSHVYVHYRSIYAIGTSGGACAASYLFGGWDIDKTVQFICSCARYARRHPKRLLDVLQYCDGAIERFMKKDDGMQTLIQSSFLVAGGRKADECHQILAQNTVCINDSFHILLAMLSGS